jgi:hypothetical protein
MRVSCRLRKLLLLLWQGVGLLLLAAWRELRR